MPHTFERSCTLSYPASVVFDWHARPGAFERLNPPWRPVKQLKTSGSIQDGARITIQIPLIGQLGIPWELQHSGFEAGRQFCDEQVKGPFAQWHHRHKIDPIDENSCTLTDTITYELPLVARWARPLVERELDRLFRFRHARLASDLTLQQRFANQPRKTFLISGASGFIGTALCSFLTTAGHSVRRLVRHETPSTDEHTWYPEKNYIQPGALDGVDVVVHLAGENIAARRWNPQQKAMLRESRIHSSSLLAQTITELPNKPPLFIAASATGIYGDTGNTLATERSTSGTDFLSLLGQDWENSYAMLASHMRVVSLRFGTVLSPRGGALQKMLPPFKAGVGGKLGNGAQYMSWIALQDVLGAIEHVVFSEQITGPVNVVSPEACTNAAFTKALGAALHRPTLFPVPAFVLRTLFGELADHILLASSRVAPDVLTRSGYHYLCPTLESALRLEGVTA